MSSSTLASVKEHLSHPSRHQLKCAMKPVGCYFSPLFLHPPTLQTLTFVLNSPEAPWSQRYLLGDIWRAPRLCPGAHRCCVLLCCSELQKEGEGKGLGFVFFFFIFPCRSFKSCNSVMNIHFNVVLKIQPMTP